MTGLASSTVNSDLVARRPSTRIGSDPPERTAAKSVTAATDSKTSLLAAQAP